MDDFLSKKKEAVPILDLAKSVANTKEDFKKLCEKIPEFKIKPQKMNADSIKIREKHFRFKTRKADLKKAKEPYVFQDPFPKEMREVKLNDLASVTIDWRMLTTVRPKTKLEENYFTRLVELKKLDNKTREFERRQYALDPQIRRTKNKAGIVEFRVVCCRECGEDFCDGKACMKFGYDYFERTAETPAVASKPSPDAQKEKSKRRKSRSKDRKLKQKGAEKRKSKSKSPKKKSPNPKMKSSKSDSKPKRSKSKSKSPKKSKSKTSNNKQSK